MNMHDAQHQAHLWLDWGQFAKLPEPNYIAISVHRDIAYVGYQFDAPSQVAKWAESFAITCQQERFRESLITRAILKTDRCDLECYHVAPATPMAEVVPIHRNMPTGASGWAQQNADAATVDVN